jgi:hypothetical protein
LSTDISQIAVSGQLRGQPGGVTDPIPVRVADDPLGDAGVVSQNAVSGPLQVDGKDDS